MKYSLFILENIIIQFDKAGIDFLFALFFETILLFLCKRKLLDLRNKSIKICRLQEGQICILRHFLTDTKVCFRYIVNTYGMVKLTLLIFIASNTNGNDIRVSCMMQDSVCLVHGTIDGKGVDILEVRLVLSCLIFDMSFAVKLYKPILIALVLNQNRIALTILVL